MNEELSRRFGSSLGNLPEVERSALALTVAEGQVTHSRLRDVTEAHSYDLSKSLSALVKEGFLSRGGAKRGAYYFFPDSPPSPQYELFGEIEKQEKSGRIDSGSEHLPPNSEHLPPNSEHLPPNSEHLEKLKTLVLHIRGKKKVSKEAMKAAVLTICEDGYLSLQEMAEILDRNSKTLQVHYISRMISEGDLVLLHPNKINHPKQKYTTSKK